MLRTSRLISRVYRRSLASSHRYQSSNEPPPNQTLSRGFYKILNIPENSTQPQIFEAYQDKCDSLSDQLTAAKEEDMDQIMEELYRIDKAFKVLKDPFQKRDYDMKLKLNKLEELDEEHADPDNHYRNLFSDKAYTKFVEENERVKELKESERIRLAEEKRKQEIGLGF